MKKVLGFLGSGVKAAAGLLGGPMAQKAIEVIDAITKEAETNPEMQKLLQDHEATMVGLALQDAEGARQLIREGLKSEDAYVRRVRPTFLYLIYVLLIFNFIVMPILSGVAGIGVEIVQLTAEGAITTNGAEAVETIAVNTIVYPELPEPLWWAFTSSFLGYAGFRSWDKRNKLKNGEKKL